MVTCHPQKEFVLKLFEIDFEMSNRAPMRIFGDQGLGHVESLQNRDLNFQVNELHRQRQIKASERTIQSLSQRMAKIGELESERRRKWQGLRGLREDLEKLQADRDRIVKSFMGEIENNVNFNCRAFLGKIQRKNRKKIEEIVVIEGGR